MTRDDLILVFIVVVALTTVATGMIADTSDG